MFDELNEFFARMMRGEGAAAAQQMATTLSSAIQGHFTEEEREMRARNYPGFAEHHAQHQAFLQRFAALRRDLEADAPDTAQALFAYVADWLKDHILKQDKALAAFQGLAKAA